MPALPPRPLKSLHRDADSGEKKNAKILIKPPTYESQEGFNKFNMC